MNGPPPLRELYAYLTEGCNLACRHCWLAPRHDPDLATTRLLALGELERALDEALPLGLRTVKLTGGEPLLHPDIAGVLDLLAQRGLEVVVETNGVLLSAALADLLAVSGAEVSVSLDGASRAVHDHIRGVAGAYDGAVRAVALLAERGLAPQVIFSLLRANMNELLDAIELAAGLGAGSFKVNIVQPTARGLRLHESGEAPSMGEIIEIAQSVYREPGPAAPIDVIVDVPPAFRPLSVLARPLGGAGCAVLTVIGLLPDGSYALCGVGQHIPDLVFGRVGADALAPLWATHPVLTELREGLPHRLHGVCATCLLRDSCLGECIAQNYYRAHDLFAPYWFCDEADGLGLFPSSRRRPA